MTADATNLSARNSEINADRLRNAIRKTLQVFPFAGGRYVYDAEGDRWDIYATGDGVEYRVVDAICPYDFEQCCDLSLGCKSALTFTSKICILPNNFRDMTRDAVLNVQLTRFNGGAFSVITISPCHALFDAASIVKLIHILSFFMDDDHQSSDALPFGITFERRQEAKECWRKLNSIDLSDHPAWPRHMPFSAVSTDEHAELVTKLGNNHEIIQLILRNRTIKSLKEQLKHHRASVFEIVVSLVVRGSQGGVSTKLKDELSHECLLLTVTNLRNRCSVFPGDNFIGNAAECLASRVMMNVADSLEDTCSRVSSVLRNDLKQRHDEVSRFIEGGFYCCLIKS